MTGDRLWRRAARPVGGVFRNRGRTELERNLRNVRLQTREGKERTGGFPRGEGRYARRPAPTYPSAPHLAPQGGGLPHRDLDLRRDPCCQTGRARPLRHRACRKPSGGLREFSKDLTIDLLV
ncbi:uncharacterized protein KIAA0040 homolog isoform X2 [Panthera leo]|uniref:uncharacterized protein KIAA0040 homolog isoform X2 n=1 Tax=Panthera leo TaxID=9689 RepID=UPI001C69DF2E|nr:uncharacterized protein KIAA0040 homolog isoform X2 [Panthera leo]